jgi:SAM-dependent methyltransferase
VKGLQNAPISTSVDESIFVWNGVMTRTEPAGAGDPGPSAADVERGQRVYTPLVLRGYDLVVLRFSNRFAWRCRSETMLERYDRYVGRRHLDLGVGTGWYLDRCRWPIDAPEITLVDLNENSLSVAARRLARYSPQTVRANVLEPLPLGEARFDSVSANYLLHCLPGQIEQKAATLAGNVGPYLEPGSVLFGSTILGRGVPHTRLGGRLMRVYNRKGIFSNAEDDERGLQRGLATRFQDVEIDVVGAVALFVAKA